MLQLLWLDPGALLWGMSNISKWILSFWLLKTWRRWQIWSLTTIRHFKEDKYLWKLCHILSVFICYKTNALVSQLPRAKIPGSARRMMGDCIGKHEARVSRFCKISPAIGWEMEERPWDTTCVYVVEEPGAVRGVPLSDPVAEDQLLCGRDLQRSHQYWQQWDSAMGQSGNIIGLSQHPSQIKSILHKMNCLPDTLNRWTNEARFD